VEKLRPDRRMTRKCGKICTEHGALAYTECLADDVKPGKLTSFPQSLKLKLGETVVFAWIVYVSRAHRDRVSKMLLKADHLPWQANKVCRQLARIGIPVFS
jgi:uncharacterized protein YbaA (DUF1428 family)